MKVPGPWPDGHTQTLRNWGLMTCILPSTPAHSLPSEVSASLLRASRSPLCSALHPSLPSSKLTPRSGTDPPWPLSPPHSGAVWSGQGGKPGFPSGTLHSAGTFVALGRLREHLALVRCRFRPPAGWT